MADVDQLKEAIQKNFITPLNRLPKEQIRLLDTTYDQSVTDFQNAIGQLFQPHNAFAGSAASALAEMVGNYLQTEQQVSNYDRNSTSEKISKLIQVCESAVTQIQPLLGQLQNNAGWGVAGATLTQNEQQVNEEMPPGLEDPIWDIAQLVLITIAAGTVIWVTIDQQAKTMDLLNHLNQWKSDMQSLAAQLEPKVPGEPANIMNNVAQDLPNVPFVLNNRELTIEEGEIAQQLFEEFNGAVSLDDILDIIRNNPGLSAEQYNLLVEYYKRYRVKPFDVLGVVGVGKNKKGDAAKIFFISEGDMRHIRGIHGEFDTLSDQEVATIITKLLQMQPDWVDNKRDSDVYWYDDVEIDGKYLTIGIAVSKNPQNPGRVVSTYQQYGQ